MNRDHPNYAACIAWANGEPIQYRYMEGPWEDWECDHDTPGFHSYYTRFRPKLETLTVCFRSYLYQSSDGIDVDIVQKSDIDRFDPEMIDGFIKWVDLDWITATVENLDG